MTSNEYIVKNCPSCRQYQVGIYTCDDLYDCDLQRCQDCADCVIKQVIEIAKDIIQKDCYENSDVKAEKILQLFDIEEINK